MTETRFRMTSAPYAMLVVMSAMLVASGAAAQSPACSFSGDPAVFESCSKAIAAKQLRGLDLAKIYATRGSLNYFYKKDLDGAIADFGEAIKLAPGFAQAYVDRGFVFDNGKKDYDRAIADYNNAIRLDPKNAEAFARRASANSSKNQYDAAIADYGQAIGLKPKDPGNFFSRGSIYYYHKKDYDRAIADFNEAIALRPDNATYVASRGESYEKKGDLARAMAEYRQALSIEPGNRWATEGLQRIEPKAATAPPAEQKAVAAPAKPAAPPVSNAAVCTLSIEEAAYAACSRLIASGTLRASALADAYETRGSISRWRIEPDKAIEDYTAAIRIDPNHREAYLHRGWVFLTRKDDYERAAADLDEALRIAPKNAESHFMRGLVYDAVKNYDLALAELDESIRLEPIDEFFIFRALIRQYRKDDGVRALADLDEAVRQALPGSSRAALPLALRARLHQRLGNGDKTREDLASSAALSNEFTNIGIQVERHLEAGAPVHQAMDRAQRGEDPPASVATAPADATPAPAVAAAGPVSCQDMSGAYEAAIEVCTQLIMSGKAGGDELLSAYVWRGSHLSFLGAHDRAIDDFDRAIKLEPKLALAYRGRGASYESKGEVDRALADYRMALSIDPSLDDMPGAIQRLESRRAQ